MFEILILNIVLLIHSLKRPNRTDESFRASENSVDDSGLSSAKLMRCGSFGGRGGDYYRSTNYGHYYERRQGRAGFSGGYRSGYNQSSSFSSSTEHSSGHASKFVFN